MNLDINKFYLSDMLYGMMKHWLWSHEETEKDEIILERKMGHEATIRCWSAARCSQNCYADPAHVSFLYKFNEHELLKYVCYSWLVLIWSCIAASLSSKAHGSVVGAQVSTASKTIPVLNCPLPYFKMEWVLLWSCNLLHISTFDNAENFMRFSFQYLGTCISTCT